ncbi:hypothetical protein Forpe1208_v009971 [Fusarium oxysporum f. sp. rapae]|uniref:Uncharacterized protein n=1 Tax=Fusarium oxysporum f. sp. rapae TaxID=485398 RepID=A0A8J5NRT7_FUSOX|nr:hypothetical protein Forpe1208_v009971 [Fusarium oxysporum f. sp. rapae]
MEELESNDPWYFSGRYKTFSCHQRSMTKKVKGTVVGISFLLNLFHPHTSTKEAALSQNSKTIFRWQHRISFMTFRPYLVTLGRTAIFISLSMMKLLASQARPPVHRYMSPQLSSTEHNSVVREIQHSISNTPTNPSSCIQV